ncbi:dTDP-4-dehydrorhamnose reductase [Pseudoduganella sp. GCM10020061]|uniref:dTDP-4-dehydrorhamnose reductase n=1 Tax=Pseudoduganella sp. GCM10020061 TaxID=3317345 RepID=UPI00363B65FC
MRILLTGCSGQVGYELERSLQALGEVVAVDRGRMDLSDLVQVREVVRAVRPDLIVNPAAYSAVDKAESEPELARRINALAPGVMAEEARRLGAAMVQYSTDYVFDGTKQGPYLETDPANPLNVYGRTKLEGEQLVAAAGIDHLILRTSWVYGLRGKNFLLTMLRLAKERGELRVVSDQHGAPTWSRTIADTTAVLLAQARAEGWWQRHGGTYHLTARGETTWYGFAQAIMEMAGLESPVLPIPGADYPAAARRPANSLMNADKLTAHLCALPHWKTSLRLCMR